MDYTMTNPCAKCPFRTDCLQGWLGRSRAQQIANSLDRSSFPCHETTTATGKDGKSEKHCAGVLILCEKEERPSQMMRICERLGMYDRTKLNMESPVFDSFEEFVSHHAN